MPRLSFVLAVFGVVCCAGFLPAQQIEGSLLFEVQLPVEATIPSIEANLDGMPLLFLVDTGNTFSLADESLKELAISELEKRNAFTADKEISISFAEVRSLKVQKLFLEKPTIGFSEVTARARQLDSKVRGILGVEDMKGKLLIDFDERRLMLHDGGWIVDSEESKRFSFKTGKSIPTVSTTIGGVAVDFAIDTGSDSPIYLPRKVFEELKASGFIESRSGSFVSGPLHMDWFAKGTLMDADLRGMRIRILENADRGLLGISWLAKFNCELEWNAGAGEIRFVKRVNPAAPMNLMLSIGGILDFYSDGAKVMVLRPDQKGPLESAGISLGDVILSIGELSGDQMNSGSVKSLLVSNVGKSLPFRVRSADGKTPKSGMLRVDSLVSDWDFPGKILFEGK